ncbi:unnamed protein product [Closterium sp. Naga37s-1]|nr:unnamed protein product [Closterium sp. Naga37s-1]
MKLHETTLSVKGDIPVSREDLSVAVTRFPNLSHLHLSSNGVECVDDAFLAHLASSCPKLTTLHVGRSLLHLPRLAHFSTLGHYQNYQPAGAASVALPSPLKSLKFFVSCPEWDIIFPLASPFIGLEELLITNCSGLETLPDRMGDLLPCLRKLTIRDCQSLACLPESFVSLSRLETLVFCMCRFPLPSNFGHLPALKVLVLERLCLRELPASFCHLLSLEALFLVKCFVYDVQQLPEGFCRLTALKLSQLKVLKLNNVRVRCGRAVSGRLPCLQQLEQLEMRLGGDSRELSVPLTFLPHLRSLLIDAPGVCSLPEDMVAAFPQLRQLELLSWSPGKLPGSVLELRTLTSLSINAPRLVSLPHRMRSLSRLRKMQLISCSALQQLPAFLTQLHHLILHDTSMRSLPANLVQFTKEP